MKRAIGTVIIAAVFGIPATSDGGGRWAIHGVDSGVTVFTAPVRGSDVPKVRAIAEVSASTDRVWSYINGKKFNVKGLKERKSLGKCGAGCELKYIRIGYPFIDDRHYVTKITSKVSNDSGSNRYYRTWREVSGRTPIDPEAIIVEMVNGSWTLEPLDGGKKTRITYENHIDLGGDIPPSLFKNGFVNSAYSIVQNVMEKN